MFNTLKCEKAFPWIIIGVALMLKLSYLGFSYYESHKVSDVEIQSNWVQQTYFGNDSGWYLRIVNEWYPKVEDKLDLGCCTSDCFYQSPYGFFPLFPGIIRAVHKITSLNSIGIGIIVANLFSLLSFLLFYRFSSEYFKSISIGFWSTMILMLFPYHYFFSMMYTESLFLFLTLLAFYSIYKGKYSIAAISFGFLVVLRPNGLFTGLPLFIYVLEREGLLRNLKGLNRKLAIKIIAIWLPGLLVFALYCYFQFNQTGDFFAFKTAQAGWCKKFGFPFLALFKTSEQYVQVNSIYTVVFMLLAVLIPFIKRIPIAFHLLIWINLLLPLTSGSPLAMPRYISVIFPFFFYLGYFVERKDLRLRIGVCIVLFTLQLYTYTYWLSPSNLMGF